MIGTDNQVRHYWRQQLRLECKQLDAEGRLVRIPGPNPDPIPTCLVTRFNGRYEMVFGWFADQNVRDELRQHSPKTFFVESHALANLMRTHNLRLEHCSTYGFTSPTTPPSTAVVRTGPEEFAAIVDEREVAWASSSRSNAESAELWVRTEPAYQRRGYARQVATAWAAAVTSVGKVGFYSHLVDNYPSAALAADLGVVHLFDLAAVVPTHPDEGEATQDG